MPLPSAGGRGVVHKGRAASLTVMVVSGRMADLNLRSARKRGMPLLGLGDEVFVPAQAAAFATISPEATGRASTMFNVVRQLGGAVGVAVLTTVIVAVGATSSVAGRVVANLAAYHVALGVAAGVAVVGAAVALTIHDADAASTMVRRGRRKAEPRGRTAPVDLSPGQGSVQA